MNVLSQAREIAMTAASAAAAKQGAATAASMLGQGSQAWVSTRKRSLIQLA